MDQVGVEGLPMWAQTENDTSVPLRMRYAAWRGTERAGEIVAYLEQAALNLFAGGAARVSINQLVESARVKYGHVNNSWRSFIARELIARHPQLTQVLETRSLKRKVS